MKRALLAVFLMLCVGLPIQATYRVDAAKKPTARKKSGKKPTARKKSGKKPTARKKSGKKLTANRKKTGNNKKKTANNKKKTGNNKKAAKRKPTARKPVEKKPVEKKPVEKKPVVNRPLGKIELAVPARFESATTEEVPDFRRHVTPLLGKLGCNGRSCHGSFQGRGGFRLSLFGHDFKMDHDALTKAADEEASRVNLEKPSESLMLQKPTEIVDHEGGLRFEPKTWQYRLLHAWIKGGAKGTAKDASGLKRLEVTPAEIVFSTKGQQTQLKVVAVWNDGTREDVTPLCRFKANDDQVAAISTDGQITGGKPGDTNVVVFYDSGVVPVPVMRPFSDKIGNNYPQVKVPTEIDWLVVSKLKKLGIVPSELCTDAEFLRRVSLDLVGTLPTSSEVEAFLKNTSPEKRSRKVEELLERPAYAAWWATRLCDFTGNNDDVLNNVVPSRKRRASQDWYDWLQHRVANNTPYDKIVEGLVMATSREKDENFKEFSTSMSGLYQEETAEKFAEREGMPYFWARRNFRKPEERAIGFAYTFLGIRIQCAQCHKHPFDQWTKDDFAQFQGFFTRVNFGVNPSSKGEYNQMLSALNLGDKKGGQQRKAISEALGEGKTVPFQEVYVVAPRKGKTPAQKAKGNQAKALKNLKAILAKSQQRLKKLEADGGPAAQIKSVKQQIERLKKRQKNLMRPKKKRGNGNAPASTAKLLGGESFDLTKQADARAPVMEWLRRKDNRLFARAFVNRVWANYFNVGIVDPPDDHSLANPPSNGPLLAHLSQAFIEHNFDIKWLHREIINSRTYQLSWQPNETNRLDDRNFSHSIPRRMPAEVVYDAIQQVTASDERAEVLHKDVAGRAIAIAGAGRRGKGRNGPGYALSVFGRSTRESNCDCDRSSEPSLLQTVFLQNDRETLQLIAANRQGWVEQVAGQLGVKSKARKGPMTTAKERALQKRMQNLRRQQKKARAAKRVEEVKKLQAQIKAVLEDLDRAADGRTVPKTQGQAVAGLDASDIVKQAYLRTLSRYPSAEELIRSRRYLETSDDTMGAVRDLLWVLMNTKEFIVNH